MFEHLFKKQPKGTVDTQLAEPEPETKKIRRLS